TEGAGALAPVFKVTDPVEAAKRFVQEARSKADIVVVLAHLPTSKAIEVAHSVPGIDVLISGNEQEFTRPFRVGKTLMLFTSYETHSIGEVRFYPSAEGGFTAKQRFISLDTGMVDDPEATKFVADMVAVVKESTKRFSDGTTSQQPPSQGSPAQKPVFAGSAECSKCHTPQYMTWLNSPHAHATTSLAPKVDELDVGCFVCHTTGFGKGGFAERGPAMMKFSNVQCEQCHGPALEHIAKPDKSYGKISNVSALCGTCHTGQTSPEFKYTSAWEAIKH
ncbi:MAG: multiheme c-type cytochrome, partial [Blastocatellia bacterium]